MSGQSGPFYLSEWKETMKLKKNKQGIIKIFGDKMKIKAVLGIQAGVVTKNGNLYTKECLKRAIEEYSKNRVNYVFKQTNDIKIGKNLSDVVGTVTKIKLNKKGFIEVEIDSSNFEYVEKMAEGVEFGLDGIGKVENGIVSNYKIFSISAIIKEK